MGSRRRRGRATVNICRILCVYETMWFARCRARVTGGWGGDGGGGGGGRRRSRTCRVVHCSFDYYGRPEGSVGRRGSMKYSFRWENMRMEIMVITKCIYKGTNIYILYAHTHNTAACSQMRTTKHISSYTYCKSL